MPNNKVHSRSKLQGKKGSSATNKLHPHSRRAHQFERVNLREEKLAARQSDRTKRSHSKTNAILWFAFALDPECACLSLDQVHELCADFLARHDEAIAEEERTRRPGRPKSKKQEGLEEQRDREGREYSLGGGLLVPDLTDEVAVHNIKHWADELDGNASFYPKLRLAQAYKGKELVVMQEGLGKVVMGSKSSKIGQEADVGDAAMDVEATEA